MNIFLRILSLVPHITIMRDGEPYLTRYHLFGGDVINSNHPWLPFNLFLHCFHQSDGNIPHSHPWRWARSLILLGRYTEHRFIGPHVGGSWCTWDEMTHRQFVPGMVNSLDGEMFHFVTIDTVTVWTLFLVGRRVQAWGFMTDRGFIPATEFVGPDVIDGD